MKWRVRLRFGDLTEEHICEAMLSGEVEHWIEKTYYPSPRYAHWEPVKEAPTKSVWKVAALFEEEKRRV